jgi:hypothetical protein
MRHIVIETDGYDARRFRNNLKTHHFGHADEDGCILQISIKLIEDRPVLFF